MTGGRGLSLLWLALAGCSTIVQPTPLQECEVDDDCAMGLVCDPFSTRCVSGEALPPRTHLAFDIQERGAGQTLFRAEVNGCDAEVSGSDASLGQLVVSRTRITQTFSLYAYGVDDPVDPNAPTADELITARFELSQDSRLGLPPNPVERQVDQAFTVDEVPVRTRVEWPRYDIFNDNRPNPYIVWETFPTVLGPAPAEGDPMPEVAPAPLVRMLVPPDTYMPLDDTTGEPFACTQDEDCGVNTCLPASGECTLIKNPGFTAGLSYESRCNRRVRGSVARYDLASDTVGDPIEGATVRFRYADPPPDPEGEVDTRLGVAPLGLSQAEGCEDDEACGEGRFCQLSTGRCLLALAGRAADTASGSATDADGTFATQLYSYCEGAPDDTISRAYTASVTPGSGLPSLSYAIQIDYPIPGGESNVSPTGAPLCVPDWGQAVTMQLPLQGAPRALATAADGTPYTCCDVGCLPAQSEDAMVGPGPAPGACGGRTAAGATPAVRFTTPLVITDAEALAWHQQQGCVAPQLPEGEGPFTLGELRTDATCPADGEVCEAEGLAPGDAAGPRRYAVRIASPTGSVLASRDLEIDVTADAEPLAAMTLPARVLVRGVVDVGDSVCELRGDTSDCASRGAVVLAERIAMPGEGTANVPGPYLHQVATFHDPSAARDGAFVLPLDPGGVYVLTALPAPGEDGGPADFQLVDLREGTEPSPLRFVLEGGILVTMNLSTFDRRTSLVPLDTGSFLDPPMLHPGLDRPLDLNQIGECLTPVTERPQGCKIRRLVPPGSTIGVSQAGFARFSARRATTAAVCGDGAP